MHVPQRGDEEATDLERHLVRHDRRPRRPWLARSPRRRSPPGAGAGSGGRPQVHETDGAESSQEKSCEKSRQDARQENRQTESPDSSEKDGQQGKESCGEEARQKETEEITKKMKKLNVGIVGYGFMGRAHSNAYRKVNNFFDLQYQPVLKAVCARSAGNAKA